jgi:ATP phosphoribosyltransferase regulatory subunit HisZ
MFSHAEEKFHFALHALTGAAPQRQRLENAFAHLGYLKAEELPELLRPKLTEIQEELEYVSGIAWHVSASAAIAKMSDEQVSQLARRVHDLHDALMNLSRPYPTSASDIK